VSWCCCLDFSDEKASALRMAFRSSGLVVGDGILSTSCVMGSGVLFSDEAATLMEWRAFRRGEILNQV
jgi:hypothetical protein